MPTNSWKWPSQDRRNARVILDLVRIPNRGAPMVHDVMDIIIIILPTMGMVDMATVAGR